ncbi:MAG: PQQ-binding-like beta-propeller repeat protein [Planctomycetes bacterium]|nr:PQQ-binding-like beta-propeller repeat protein [Planctomycetota bacterium]
MTSHCLRAGRACVMIAAALTSITAVAAAPWPQWRGPDGEGHAPDAHDLPITWSETEHVAWKTPLPGRGWSSPVLDERLVWMTTAIDREATDEEKARRAVEPSGGQARRVATSLSLRAVAVDRDTGRLVHDVELFVVDEPQPIHALNSYASPSPVLAEGRLYCHFGDFGTACVEAATGRVLWANRELRLDHMNGPGSTPVVWNGLLIVNCDGIDVQFVAALDTVTGQIAWKTARSGTLRDDPDVKKAYATPIIVRQGNRDVLVSPGADWLYGYDPATGRELWRMSYGDLGFSVVPRPVTGHGLVYMSTSFNQPRLLAVKLADDGHTAEIAWQEKKGAPSMPSPLVVGERLVMVSDKGVATFLDAATGATVATLRLGGNFSSSPLFAAGRIYVGNRDGDTFVIDPGSGPGEEPGIVATNHLDGRIFATPAAVGDSLYLRTDTAIYRLALPKAAP